MIDSGTFQTGLTITTCMAFENSGVGVSFLPTTTRFFDVAMPSRNTVTTKSGTLTSMRSVPSSRGIQRHISMLATSCPSSRDGRPPASAVIVRLVSTLEAGRPLVFWKSAFATSTP